MKKIKTKQMLKRLTAFAAAAAMAAAFTFTAEVGESIFDGFGNAITASAEAYTAEYDISVGSVTIDADGTYRIYSNDPSTSVTNTITVKKDVSADITLENVNIDVSKTGTNSNDGDAAFLIEYNSTGNVTIDLVGENTLKSGKRRAGLETKKRGGSINVGKLTIKSENGTGKLTATGGDYGAGIGGGDYGSSSNITISGGTVTATGGDNGAGIGGGDDGYGSNITISGGTVTANGGDYGAGIGGGDDGSGSNITISGGSVYASGGSGSAGIGGGELGTGSNITISGGTVTANGGYLGAGIGGGRRVANGGTGSNITISDGIVTATGGSGGAGIGGGDDGDGSNISISDGIVTATGGSGGAGIGGGRDDYGSNITISGGSVYAKGGEYLSRDLTISAYGADIGGGVRRFYTNQGESYKDGMPEDTTCDGTESVYLLEIENPTGADIQINNVDYPKSHTYYDIESSAFVTETKIYAYLPEMFLSFPNKVTVGDTITLYYYDTSTDSWIVEAHTHSYGTEWKSDSTSHWHECACGEKTDVEPHTEDSGTVTVEPTETTEGVKTFKCVKCERVMRTEAVQEIEKPVITKTVPGDGQVALNWTEVKGAKNYAVYTYLNKKWTLAGTTTALGRYVKGLTNGVKYGFAVKAYVNGKWTTVTSEDIVYATPTGAAKPVITKAEAGDKQVAVNWTAVTGASKYALYTYVNGKWTLVGTRTTTGMYAKNLTNGVKYGFAVKAYVNGKWTSVTSKDIVYATPTAPASQKPIITKAVAGNGQVALNWTSVSGATNYAVFTYLNGEWTLVGTRNATGMYVKELTNGVKYGFAVKAYVNGKWTTITKSDVVYATPTASKSGLIEEISDIEFINIVTDLKY